MVTVLGTASLLIAFNSRRYNNNPIALTRQSSVKGVESVKVCPIQESINYYYYDEGDSLWGQNNKFGIYIYAENETFFEKAQELVNSNGGKWGYVLIPYGVNDRDSNKWERVFEQLRDKKLIPIIQLWGLDIHKYKKQTVEAATFLNRFPWPIRYRYVSVYNEPNDSKFWFGNADPVEYAKVLAYTIQKFKEENVEFYMLNGALNVSSPNDGQNIDAFDFMMRMDASDPGIFERLDGWASHSYPQPNFAGSPYATGRWSIKAYADELEFLKNSLGVTKNLPVFITETGWAHAEGLNYQPSYPTVATMSEYLKLAYENVWLKDDRVRAVMPFTIYYNPPFDHFSWLNSDYVPYAQFDTVKKMSKVAGEPPRIQKATLVMDRCLQ